MTNLILTPEQTIIFNENKKILAKIHNEIEYSTLLNHFKNTLMSADKIGNIATWKIYNKDDLNQYYHIDAFNYSKLLKRDDIIEASQVIDEKFIQEPYVVKKIDELKKALEPYQYLKLELIKKRTVNQDTKHETYSWLIIVDINQVNLFKLRFNFFETNKDNIVPIIKSTLEAHAKDNPNMYLDALNHVTEVFEIIKEKNQIQKNIKTPHCSQTKIKI
jgi:hypothetical protein